MRRLKRLISRQERERREMLCRVAEARQAHAVAEYRARTVEAEVAKAAQLKAMRLARDQGGHSSQ